MKRLLLSAALAVLPATYANLALAQEATPHDYAATPAISGKTRAEVRAELIAARAAGELPASGEAGQPLEVGASTRTRSEVRAEVIAARANGELPPVGEAGYPVEAKAGPQARADAVAAVQRARAR